MIDKQAISIMLYDKYIYKTSAFKHYYETKIMYLTGNNYVT